MILKELKDELTIAFNYQRNGISSKLNFNDEIDRSQIHYEFLGFGIGLKLQLSEQVNDSKFLLLKADFTFFGEVEEITMNDHLYSDLLELNKIIYGHVIDRKGIEGYSISLANRLYNKQELLIFNFLSKILSSVKDSNKRQIYKNILFPKQSNFDKSNILFLKDETYLELEKTLSIILKLSDFLYNKPLLFNPTKLRVKSFVFDSLIYNSEIEFWYYGKYLKLHLNYSNKTIDVFSGFEVTSYSLFGDGLVEGINDYLNELEGSAELYRLLNEDFSYLKEFIKREYLIFDFSRPYFSELTTLLLQYASHDEIEETFERVMKTKEEKYTRIFSKEHKKIEVCARTIELGGKNFALYEVPDKTSIKVILI